MIQYLKIVIIIILCAIPFTLITGQQEKQSRDKFTLLTMAYNQRPLLLYKGQLQINTSYRFATRTKSFDSDGNKISLKENGTASVIHTYLLEIKYGITDFIEICADSYYLLNGIRSGSTSTLSGSGTINTNTLVEYKGFGDLSLAASVRVPIEYKKWDISLRGGITLPLAEYKPSKPNHVLTDYTSPNNFTVNYRFNNNNGNGVPVSFVSMAAKLTFSKLSLEARGAYRFPLKEVESIRWGWTLYGSTFTYFSNPYTYQQDRSLTINGSIHYQAAGWFDLFVSGYSLKTTSGWSEFYGIRYANPKTSLLTVEPGFELQITPSLTVYQYAGFHIAGTDTDAPFYFLTTLSFNMFPFWK